jgi:dTMP kinase
MVGSKPKLKYYEVGMDLNLSRDPYDSYRIFQSRIIDQYEYMVKPQGFIVIDGTSGIEEQQKLVRERVKDILPLIQQQQQSLSQKLVVTSNE